MASPLRLQLVAAVAAVALWAVLPPLEAAAAPAPSTATATPTTVRCGASPCTASTPRNKAARSDAVALAPPSMTGATYTTDVLSGLQTVWGHDAEAMGAGRLGEGALSRTDLLRELREHAPSADCRRALDAALDARERLVLWALKMHTSSATLPDALLAGAMYNFGDFDGCASSLDAMYCLVDVEIRPSTPTQGKHDGDELSPYQPPHGANATLWDLFKTSGNRRRFRRDLQQWALCLPAVCGRPNAQSNDAQLGKAIAASVSGVARAFGVQLQVHLDASDCYDFTDQRSGFDNFYQALRDRPLFLYGSIFILAFPLLTLIASMRALFREKSPSQDAPEKQEVSSQKKLDCFSIQTNWKRLRHKQPSQIHAIQGLRTITMFLIIFGHRSMYLFGGPVHNPEYVEDSFTRALKMTIINGNVVVSTFFVISGFLEARQSMMHIGKMRRFDLIVVMQHYAIRYFRLLPSLAVVVAIEVLWVEMMGSGPIWNQVVGRSVHDCKANWWAHLLFINNYYSPDSRCLIQTWFAAAVLQMYIFIPFFMWLVSRWTLRALWPGCLLLGLLFAGAAATHYATTLSLGLHPMVHTYPQVLRRQNVVMDATFTHQYVATHNNAVPYVVGLVVGTLFYLAHLRGWRPSKRLGTFLLLAIPVGLLLQLATFVSGLLFFVPTFEPRPLLDAAYGPARLLAFSVPTAWIIFTCGIGVGGVFEKMLTWTPMVVLGRLTYTVYLVHLTVITVTTGYTRQPENLTNYGVASRTLSDVVVSYFLALLLHLCVEAPMANLQVLVVRAWALKSNQQTGASGSPARDDTSPPPEDLDDVEADEVSVQCARSRRASSVTSSKL